MPRIILDFDPPLAEAPEFEQETSDLVYFLSWAYSARFGASHELSQAALILRGEFKIDLAPLLTFTDRFVETLKIRTSSTAPGRMRGRWRNAASRSHGPSIATTSACVT